MKKQTLRADGRVYEIEEWGKTDIHVVIDGEKSCYVIKRWGSTDRWYVVKRSSLGDEAALHYGVSNGVTIFGRTMTFKSTERALAAAARDHADTVSAAG